MQRPGQLLRVGGLQLWRQCTHCGTTKCMRLLRHSKLPYLPGWHMLQFALVSGSRMRLFPDCRGPWFLSFAAGLRRLGAVYLKQQLSGWMGLCICDVLQRVWPDLHPTLLRHQRCCGVATRFRRGAGCRPRGWANDRAGGWRGAVAMKNLASGVTALACSASVVGRRG